MATVNNRLNHPLAGTINAVTPGGITVVSFQRGFERAIASQSDGLAVPLIDREVQYCRGSVTSEDWTEMINLITSTTGTFIFYERELGAATYRKHTFVNPVIHRVRLSMRQGGNATISFDFECKAADETKGFAAMYTALAAQVAPTYVSAARGGYRISAAAHGALAIYHVTAFELEIALQLVLRCNDADVGYTCVDLEQWMAPSGSISFEDAAVATGADKAGQLLAAARASLVLTITQAGGASAKTVTVAGVIFGSGSENAGSGVDVSDFSVPFVVSNDGTTQLTLAGANKILTIA